MGALGLKIGKRQKAGRHEGPFDLYMMNIVDNDISSINVNWLSYLYNDINLSQFYLG